MLFIILSRFSQFIRTFMLISSIPFIISFKYMLGQFLGKQTNFFNILFILSMNFFRSEWFVNVKFSAPSLIDGKQKVVHKFIFNFRLFLIRTGVSLYVIQFIFLFIEVKKSSSLRSFCTFCPKYL